jgi:hypothetical protein
LAERCKTPFPDVMFIDLFPSTRGRPSVPADVMASVIALQPLAGHVGPGDPPTTFDLRWQAAVSWSP